MVPYQAIPYCERRSCSVHGPDQKFRFGKRLTSNAQDGHRQVGHTTVSHFITCSADSPPKSGRHVTTLPLQHYECLATSLGRRHCLRSTKQPAFPLLDPSGIPSLCQIVRNTGMQCLFTSRLWSCLTLCKDWSASLRRFFGPHRNQTLPCGTHRSRKWCPCES